MEEILSCFAYLDAEQIRRLEMLGTLYTVWNEKINVISRKDIVNLYRHHVLHSLAIARVATFPPGCRVLDVGTGGGFPGIPLAILFPQTEFHLIDSIGKKIQVARDIATQTGLDNVTAIVGRCEALKTKYDFVVARAVTAFPDFADQVAHLLRPQHRDTLSNGIVYLKGGEFDAEIEAFKPYVKVYHISDFFGMPFFETKKVIYLPAEALRGKRTTQFC